MVWQDILISVVMIFLSYALIPQIIKGFKTKKKLITTQTSIITTIGMFILTIAYLTLDLYFSTSIALLQGILWLTLFIQSIIYKSK